MLGERQDNLYVLYLHGWIDLFHYFNELKKRDGLFQNYYLVNLKFKILFELCDFKSLSSHFLNVETSSELTCFLVHHMRWSHDVLVALVLAVIASEALMSFKWKTYAKKQNKMYGAWIMKRYTATTQKCLDLHGNYIEK